MNLRLAGSPDDAVVYGVCDPLLPDLRAVVASMAEVMALQLGAEVVGEFIDEPTEPVIPWVRRPQAQRLLRTLNHRNNRVRTVLVPQPKAAMSGDDLRTAVVLLAGAGTAVCLPSGVVDSKPRAVNVAANALDA